MVRRAVRAMLVVITVGVLLGVGLFGGQRYLEHRVGQAVDGLLADLPAYLDGSYSAVTVNPLEQTAAVHDVRLEGAGLFPDVNIRRVSIRDYSGGTVLPEKLDVRFHDVHWVRGGWPETLAFLEGAINGPVVGDFALTMQFDPDTRALMLDQVVAELHNGDRVAFEGRFRLGDRGMLDHPYEGPASGLELVEFDGRWRDTGLFQAMLERIARDRGMTGPTLAANILGELEWAAADLEDENLENAMDAMRQFFHEPGLLHVRITPTDPINLVLLGERFLIHPPQALQRLGPDVRYTAVRPDAEPTITWSDQD